MDEIEPMAGNEIRINIIKAPLLIGTNEIGSECTPSGCYDQRGSNVL